MTYRALGAADAPAWNGYRVVSTFAGGGGSSLGYRLAGFKVIHAVEFLKAAQNTYRANHPDTPLDPRDVREVTGAEILAAIGLKAGELDVFDGSPPCTPFSTASIGRHGTAPKWGEVTHYLDGVHQRSDDLFFEYARLLGDLAPRAFVAENVTGLLRGAAKGYFKRIHAALGAAGPGYHVRAVVVDASWCGVPQRRERVFFLGLRRDLGTAAPASPAPLAQRWTLRDALGAPPALPFTAADATLTAPGPAVSAMLRRLHPGEKTSGKRLNLRRPGARSAHMFSLMICRWDRPVPTVCGQQNSAACLVHPDRRYFTLAELRRLCGYPDDYVLTNGFHAGSQRLGQSVPPPMMARVAGAVAEALRAVDARRVA